MFDNETIFVAGILKRQLNEVEHNRDLWMNHARKLEGTVSNLKQTISSKEDEVKRLSNEVARLKEQLARQQQEAAKAMQEVQEKARREEGVKKWMICRLEGANALIWAFQHEHPDSPLLKPYTEKDGQITNAKRKIYRERFLDAGRRQQMRDPEKLYAMEDWFPGESTEGAKQDKTS